MNPVASQTYDGHRALLRRIIGAYDSPVVRGYCTARFTIININILDILALCLRGKTRVLEIGCGFGLFGCFFAQRFPAIDYLGVDLDEQRIAMARRAAARLALARVRFEVADARAFTPPEPPYDAVVMIDLLHHIPDGAKVGLAQRLVPCLAADGHLIIKDITRCPRWKLAFTWALDVMMTRGFAMWYWDPEQFRAAIDPALAMEAYPIADWLPYPHIVYLFSRPPARPA